MLWKSLEYILSKPKGAEFSFAVSDCSRNSHMELSLGGRMFDVLFTFVSQTIFEKIMMKVAILRPFKTYRFFERSL
jgi:hypothetical protein